MTYTMDDGAVQEELPFGCKVCGRQQRGHGDIYTRPHGSHLFISPDDSTIKTRMKTRRNNR
jgi:hypothetical protein